MELFTALIDLFLHLDQHLGRLVTDIGWWIYLILFLVIFLETGLVVTPFLPGDSLLFAAGALAGLGMLQVEWLFVLLVAAAILGDSVNYRIGNTIGPRAFQSQSRLFKQAYLERAHIFYEVHGRRAIVLARFIPIVRTFAPFVAGIGTMDYSRFITYNILGGVVWVSIFLFCGYFFGNLPLIRDQFELVIIAVIVVSLLPLFYDWFHSWRKTRRARPTRL